VTNDARQFSSRWFYANYDSSKIQRFEATKDAIGIVWPKVTLDVMDDRNHQWIRVGKSTSPGKTVTVTVGPGSNRDLFVNFEPFTPYIGKYRLGKVTLSNGQTAEFQLKYLLPP
jgi:hypothetical protein